MTPGNNDFESDAAEIYVAQNLIKTYIGKALAYIMKIN